MRIKILVAFLIVIVVAIILKIILVIYTKITDKYCKKVSKNSTKIKLLEELNKTIDFNEQVNSSLSFEEVCSSKKKLDRIDVDEYFIFLIENNYDLFEDVFLKILDNIQKYQKYKKQYKTFESTATNESCLQIKTKLKRFIKYEDKLFNKLLISPIMEVKIKVHISYTSPAGRNYYYKNKIYNWSKFSYIFQKTEQLIKSKQTYQYQVKLERLKLTDSLRYDVLKRDCFKCQICGATAADGVRLHVDHIIPVSKGGMTKIDNLRTLCDRCNLGKSNKIE